MSCWIFAAYGLAALFFIFLLQAALPVRSRFAWMAESDSDMKLAPFPGTKFRQEGRAGTFCRGDRPLL